MFSLSHATSILFFPYSCLFQCCLLLSKLPPDVVGEKMEPERFYDSVNLILSLQVSFFEIELIEGGSIRRRKKFKDILNMIFVFSE